VADGVTALAAAGETEVDVEDAVVVTGAIGLYAEFGYAGFDNNEGAAP
jgi:hypothetical protein